MKKQCFLLTVLLCLSLLISACGKNESAAAGASPDTSPAADPPASSEPDVQKDVQKIVFHDTIDDPQGEYLNELGGGGSETSGTTVLDLVLYETEPDVYEGCGVISRSVHIAQGEAGGSTQKYVYRTGRIHAEAGKEGSVSLTGWLTDDTILPAMISEAPFELAIGKDATIHQADLPLLLTLNENKASLSIKLHEHAEFVFSGQLTADAAESPVGRPSDPENLIYINSMWSCPFSGNADGGEYTAILLASPEGGTYSGQLSVEGTGNVLAAVDQTVTFSFVPFDAAAYQAAGGQLDDTFASLCVLDTAGGTYLLLQDGEQVLLESVGTGICFCGSMPSSSEFDCLQNEAAKTKELLSSLYLQKTGTEASLPDFSGMEDLDPNDPEDMQKLIEMSESLNTLISHQNMPAWYPKDLIPMVNFSEDDGFGTLPSENELLFRIYNTIYAENEDMVDLVEPYRDVLSGYDDYQEYWDYDNAEGVILFTMGKYTIQVFFHQPVMKLTNVSIQIY